MTVDYASPRQTSSRHWTTGDELAFIRLMQMKGNWVVLHSMATLVDYRRYDDTVDAKKVRALLTDVFDRRERYLALGQG